MDSKSQDISAGLPLKNGSNKLVLPEFTMPLFHWQIRLKEFNPSGTLWRTWIENWSNWFSRCYALAEGWMREASKIIFISFASSTFVSIWEGNSHKANILQENSNQANSDQIGSI